VLVIRLNTDRGPSLARLRPTRQEMSIDDVEAAMAHDAALKAQRAARAEREAALASLTSTASDVVDHGPTSPPCPGISPPGSSLSGYTARMSFASSGNADESTPRNSSELASSTSANSSSTSTATASSPSSSSTMSGQALRVNFAEAEDDDDELMKQLIASQLSSPCNDDVDDDDVYVDDRYVRDIIHAELPPPPPSAGATSAEQRHNQRPMTVDRNQRPGASANPPSSHHMPRFVKKPSTLGALATTELGGPMSLRRNNALPVNTATDPRFALSLRRSPENPCFDVQSPTQQVSANSGQSPVNSDRRRSAPSSYRSLPWNSNVAKPMPTPTPPSADLRVANAELHQNEDTEFFVEVAHF